MVRNALYGVLAVVVVLGVVGISFAATGSQSTAAQASISEPEAVSIAGEQVNGTAQDVELEQEDGLVYEVEVVQADGTVKEIEIDGDTGDVLEIETEDEEDDASETEDDEDEREE